MVVLVTDDEVAVKLAAVEPVGTVTLGGTGSTLVLLDASVTTAPLLGAPGGLRVTVPVVD